MNELNLQGLDMVSVLYETSQKEPLYCTSKTTDGSCQEEATKRETKDELFIKH